MYYYKNNDYTIRLKIIDSDIKYFIKYHFVNNSLEHEISLDIFRHYLYGEDFRKPFDKQSNEHRRHMADGDFEHLVSSGKTDYTFDYEDRAVKKYDIEMVLKTCTSVQQRRFKLYYYQDFTFEEIARLEKCDKRRVQKSVAAAIEKIKKYFI